MQFVTVRLRHKFAWLRTLLIFQRHIEVTTTGKQSTDWCCGWSPLWKGGTGCIAWNEGGKLRKFDEMWFYCCCYVRGKKWEYVRGNCLRIFTYFRTKTLYSKYSPTNVLMLLASTERSKKACAQFMFILLTMVTILLSNTQWNRLLKFVWAVLQHKKKSKFDKK